MVQAGVHVDSRGFIETDDYQNTNVIDVYAIGDVNGRSPLTPVVNTNVRRLADHLFGNKAGGRLNYAEISTMVFWDERKRYAG